MTPPWTVVLIVEDDSDGRALALLVKRLALQVRFEWVPAGGIGEIKSRLPHLARLAKARAGSHGCVGVLVDRDRNSAITAEPHRSIREGCQKRKTAFLVAQEAIEAWFLADPDVCKWLGIPHRSAVDGIANPTNVLARAYEKVVRRPYRKRIGRLRVASKASGPDAGRSPSLKAAIDHLQRSPCAARA